MALIVEFTVPVSKFALFNTLTAVPDITLELGRVIDTTPEDITVYVWRALQTSTRLKPHLTTIPQLHRFPSHLKQPMNARTA